MQGQVRAITDKLRSFTSTSEAIADFYAQEGVICKTDVIRKALRQMEKDGTITVKRDPCLTSTGKPSTFFTSAKGQKVLIRVTEAASRRSAH